MFNELYPHKRLTYFGRKIGKARGGKSFRKFGRNGEQCALYRARVGKPLGPGVPGNKSGKRKVIR